METYPRHAALTGQFRHGQPRSFRVTDTAVYFLRSAGGRDAALRLYRWDRRSGHTEEVLAGSGDPTAAELAMRERLRETASGITTYDVRGDRLVAGVGGGLLAWDPVDGGRPVAAAHAAYDPRLSPDGAWISWVSAGALQVCRWDGTDHRIVVAADADATWAVCDFIAAEELGRSRGYWWLPESEGLLVQRTDESPVPVWHRSDPAHPDREPTPQRYPHAGAANTPTTSPRTVARYSASGRGTRTPSPSRSTRHNSTRAFAAPACG